MRAFILYAFYIGYIFSQMPGGWLADRIGARHVMGTCMVISILITFAFPLSVEYGGHIAAIALRAVLGLAQVCTNFLRISKWLVQTWYFEVSNKEVIFMNFSKSPTEKKLRIAKRNVYFFITEYFEYRVSPYTLYLGNDKLLDIGIFLCISHLFRLYYPCQ